MRISGATLPLRRAQERALAFKEYKAGQGEIEALMEKFCRDSQLEPDEIMTLAKDASMTNNWVLLVKRPEAGPPVFEEMLRRTEGLEWLTAGVWSGIFEHDWARNENRLRDRFLEAKLSKSARAGCMAFLLNKKLFGKWPVDKMFLEAWERKEGEGAQPGIEIWLERMHPDNILGLSNESIARLLTLPDKNARIRIIKVLNDSKHKEVI